MFLVVPHILGIICRLKFDLEVFGRKVCVEVLSKMVNFRDKFCDSPLKVRQIMPENKKYAELDDFEIIDHFWFDFCKIFLSKYFQIELDPSNNSLIMKI